MVKGFPPDGFLSRGRPWCKRNVDHLPIRWQRVGENRGFQRRFGFSCWQKEWHHQLWMGLFWPLINGGMGLSSRENAGCFKRQSFFTRCRDLQTFEMIFHPEWSFTQLLLMLQKCVHQLRFGDIYPTKFNKAIMGNFPMIYRVLCTYIYIYTSPGGYWGWSINRCLAARSSYVLQVWGGFRTIDSGNFPASWVGDVQQLHPLMCL